MTPNDLMHPYWQAQPGAVVDGGNSSTATLTGAGVFTGAWRDVTGFPDVVVAVSTDADGSYAVQYSPDGTNVDSTLTRYYRVGQINAPHRFTNTRQYMRVVYTNGSSAQTHFRLQTNLGAFTALNAPTDGTLARDFDATVVRPTDPAEETALGLRQGKTTWHKWGYNTDVDSAASEMIWEPGGNMTFLTTASTLDLVSSDAADDAGSTGATAVIIYGIDANRQAQTEVVTMDGLTTVTTTNTWLGVNRVALYTVGTGETNAGKITVTATTGGSTQATMPAGEGTTQQAIFFTQADHKANMNDLAIGALKLSGGSAPRVTVKCWVKSFLSGGIYEVFRVQIDTSVENHLIYNVHNPFTVGEQSVVYFSATTNTNNTEVGVRFSLIEYKDADAA